MPSVPVWSKSISLAKCIPREDSINKCEIRDKCVNAHDFAEDVPKILPGNFGVGLKIVERHCPAAAQHYSSKLHSRFSGQNHYSAAVPEILQQQIKWIRTWSNHPCCMGTPCSSPETKCRTLSTPKDSLSN